MMLRASRGSASGCRRSGSPDTALDLPAGLAVVWERLAAAKAGETPHSDLRPPIPDGFSAFGIYRTTEVACRRAVLAGMDWVSYDEAAPGLVSLAGGLLWSPKVD